MPTEGRATQTPIEWQEERGHYCMRIVWPMPRERSVATTVQEERGHNCARGGRPLSRERRVLWSTPRWDVKLGESVMDANQLGAWNEHSYDYHVEEECCHSHARRLRPSLHERSVANAA